jgi:hypothetical protein
MQVSNRVSFRAFAAAVMTIGTVMATTPLDAQEREANAFTWSGNIPAGRSILIRNINGPIRVERGSNRVEVSADKEWRRGNPEDVRIEQKRLSNDDIIVCAMWNPESRCEEGGINTPRNTSRQNNRNNDVKVTFTLRVPDGVKVDVGTVNGELRVSGATAEVIARTVNGDIEASSAGGPVRASTVNGGIDVSMGSLGNVDELEYQTVNGGITLRFPSNLSAQLDLSTVNGRVQSDFPITLSGSLSPRRIRGAIGNGAIRLNASTVNGGISVRRGS